MGHNHFLPLEERGRAAEKAVTAASVLSALQLFALLFYLMELTSLGYREDSAVAVIVGLVAFGQLVALLAGAITFLSWFRTAYRNLPYLTGEPTTEKPGWAVGAWFAPFLNLYKPMRLAKEIWAGSAVRPVEPLLVSRWWGCFIISSMSGNASFRLSLNATSTSEHIALTTLDLFCEALWVAAGVFCVQMIRRITRAQRERVEAVGSPEDRISSVGDVPTMGGLTTLATVMLVACAFVEAFKAWIGMGRLEILSSLSRREWVDNDPIALNDALHTWSAIGSGAVFVLAAVVAAMWAGRGWAIMKRVQVQGLPGSPSNVTTGLLVPVFNVFYSAGVMQTLHRISSRRPTEPTTSWRNRPVSIDIVAVWLAVVLAFVLKAVALATMWIQQGIDALQITTVLRIGSSVALILGVFGAIFVMSRISAGLRWQAEAYQAKIRERRAEAMERARAAKAVQVPAEVAMVNASHAASEWSPSPPDIFAAPDTIPAPQADAVAPPENDSVLPAPLPVPLPSPPPRPFAPRPLEPGQSFLEASRKSDLARAEASITFDTDGRTEEVRRGRMLVGAVLVLMLSMTIMGLLLNVVTGGFRVEVHGARILFTLLLCYGLHKGNRVATILTGIFSALGGAILCVGALAALEKSLVTSLAFGAFGLLLVLVPFVLFGSKSVRAYRASMA